MSIFSLINWTANVIGDRVKNPFFVKRNVSFYKFVRRNYSVKYKRSISMSLRPAFIGSLAIVSAFILTMTSCEQPNSTNNVAPILDSNSVSSSGTIKLQGHLISIPSPTQLAILVEQTKVPFRKEQLHDLAKRESYLSEQKKSLNLGIYGADLAYISNFNQGQLASDYFDAVGKSAGDLEILDHIDGKLVSRLNSNISERDSVLRLSAQFFQSADRYLKNNERTDLAGLILLGGWVESIHLATDAASISKDVRNRIGEQKNACQSLTDLMNKLDDPTLKELKDKMNELNDVYSEFTNSYTYGKPITDSKNKTTYFTSKSTIELDLEQLKEVSDKIDAIRKLITE